MKKRDWTSGRLRRLVLGRAMSWKGYPCRSCSVLGHDHFCDLCGGSGVEYFRDFVGLSVK